MQPIKVKRPNILSCRDITTCQCDLQTQGLLSNSLAELMRRLLCMESLQNIILFIRQLIEHVQVIYKANWRIVDAMKHKNSEGSYPLSFLNVILFFMNVPSIIPLGDLSLHIYFSSNCIQHDCTHPPCLLHCCLKVAKRPPVEIEFTPLVPTNQTSLSKQRANITILLLRPTCKLLIFSHLKPNPTNNAPIHSHTTQNSRVHTLMVEYREVNPCSCCPSL